MNTAHEFLSAWETYYVILGSSAAALTGLQFVVIALLVDAPQSSSADSVGAFETPTVVHFCLCLFVAAVLSTPWPSLTPIRWILFAAGISGLVYTLIALRRARRQTYCRPIVEDWLWHGILPLVSYGALIAAAALLAGDAVTALFVVGGAALTLIFIGIHNAWEAVKYIAVQRSSTASQEKKN